MPDMDADLTRGLRLLEQAPLGKLVEGIGTAIAEAQYNMDRFVIKPWNCSTTTSKTASFPTRLASVPCWSWASRQAFSTLEAASAKNAFSAMKGEEFRVGASLGGGDP